MEWIFDDVGGHGGVKNCCLERDSAIVVRLRQGSVGFYVMPTEVENVPEQTDGGGKTDGVAIPSRVLRLESCWQCSKDLVC